VGLHRIAFAGIDTVRLLALNVRQHLLLKGPHVVAPVNQRAPAALGRLRLLGVLLLQEMKNAIFKFASREKSYAVVLMRVRKFLAAAGPRPADSDTLLRCLDTKFLV
jgi:hypothetical protein